LVKIMIIATMGKNASPVITGEYPRFCRIS